MRLLRQPSSPRHAAVRDTRVHLDDIRHVVTLLTTAGYTTDVSDREYAYDDLDELVRERGVHPKSLTLTACKPRPSSDTIIVEFVGDRIDVEDRTADGPGHTSRHVAEYLARTRSRVVEYGRVGPVLLALAVGLFLDKSGWAFRTSTGVDVSGQLGLCLLGWLAVALAVRYGYAGLWLRPRHEGNFLTRNADKIGLGLVTAILGALAKTAIDRLSK